MSRLTSAPNLSFLSFVSRSFRFSDNLAGLSVALALAMPIKECGGYRSRTGSFEASGIALPLPIGPIDSTIELFYSDFRPLMAESRPAKVQNGADQIQAGSAFTLRSRKDSQMLHGRQVAAALFQGSGTETAIRSKVRKCVLDPFLATKEEGSEVWPARAVRP
jgi:hypothetical protein